ncbi:glycine-rich protein [Striga asiatica]|uniref:Glycine-rich protein n=1 Tax=Striga asiatica TaxID=4170 RepID=A0A5A7QMJ1_STRAF|nr:glycine-rich protein [Striga asiatica]
MQAENLFPFLVSDQQPPLLTAHLPDPTAEDEVRTVVTPDVKIGYVIPPNPRASRVLPEILEHDILPQIPDPKIILRIGRTVPPAVNTLRLALIAQHKRLGTIPRDVVRRKLGVPAPLQQLSIPLEATHEARLIVTSYPTLVVTVSPKLVLHSLVRVGHRLRPVELHQHLFPVRESFLERRLVHCIGHEDCRSTRQLGVFDLKGLSPSNGEQANGVLFGYLRVPTRNPPYSGTPKFPMEASWIDLRRDGDKMRRLLFSTTNLGWTKHAVVIRINIISAPRPIIKIELFKGWFVENMSMQDMYIKFWEGGREGDKLARQLLYK